MKILKVCSLLVFLSGAFLLPACAQVLTAGQEPFTRADTLRGSLRPERTAYDVLYYHLNIRVEPETRHIEGYNDILFEATADFNRIQVDLFDNMNVDSILWNHKKLDWKREFNAVFIDFPEQVEKGANGTIRFYYSGSPIVAKRPPWDGGFVWTKSENGKPWIAVACQGTGASLWWPNKDHQTEEPDSMLISVAVPDGLMNISNGRSRGTKDLGNGYTRWDWFVGNPINNYDVSVNIADYAHFSEKYKGHTLNYYVLPENLEKAKKQFQEVPLMLACFEKHFGPYPFWEDGYKLIETPYLGMEHQSAVAYGNEYKMGYLGRDLSGTGVGLKWDFIIIHESAHEWFGNSITSADIADMWIHEGFTCYSESVYQECRWGYDEAMEYINGLKRNVMNDQPVIGPYGVNREGSGDMYYKAALMLNTIRHIIDDDEKWWDMLREYCEVFRHQIVTANDVTGFFCEASGRDLRPVFRQYLNHTELPELELVMEEGSFRYRWKAEAEGFNMPVDVFIGGKERRLHPTAKWQSESLPEGSEKDFHVAEKQFFVKVSKKEGA
ncbi:peptidase M1-like protein [Anseongella ginsenosidimutans]|uniref:Peptidase M1-like protein n=1 Tax=Anseongella ginsenosidimutans TaxID=496056 RepID=A0A4R3KWN3_9SPHI|nr:M1 family metallopeptidase [Anseongella ginsenosidimutans]QEC51555.1 M1 family metallopeptidase [Anseongella ginsenosidimutans]TCS88880.1 peptidase M1-like protein [Anseongella ginsenosidimutans]